MKYSSSEKKEEKIKQTLEEAIQKTGYVLEHKVATLLEEAKWTVIHNRYYLDDVTSVQREMDILAYKSDETKSGIRIYTALIVSCKKNEEFDWVFLTRKAHGMNLNLNLLPINFSSNIDVFNYMLTDINWDKEKFIKKYDPGKLISALYNYNKIVFAYQEIRKSNNAPSNDSNIYSSISSLIKAQAYEIESLKGGRRNDKKYIYNLNLLSVADLDFYELEYEKDMVKTSKIHSINYLNRFLIGNQEKHARIDFIKFDVLKKIIIEYDKLHKCESGLL